MTITPHDAEVAVIAFIVGIAVASVIWAWLLPDDRKESLHR